MTARKVAVITGWTLLVLWVLPLLVLGALLVLLAWPLRWM